MAVPILEKDSEVQRILKESKNIAVFGISKNPEKPAYYVPKALIEKGFKIFGVNPKYSGEEILGTRIYSSLLEIPEEIDVVLVFRPPSELPQILSQAYLKGFKTFWMQPGTLNEDVKNELNMKGYNVVFERCMKKESEKYIKP